MSDSKNLGDWGKMTPTDGGNAHVTQTNSNANAGEGAHVTTHIPDGGGAVVHDHFNSNGDYLGGDFGLPKK